MQDGCLPPQLVVLTAAMICNVLPEMVDGGGHWWADDFVKRQWCDDGLYGLVNSGFVCGG